MSNFFILGLPRSRTAWLANFLTFDGNFCYHEGLDGCYTIEEYKDKLGKNKGDSNTGLMMIDFENTFPNSKVIIIDSTVTNAVKFTKNVYGTDIKELMLKAKERLDSMKGLHIRIEDINDSLKKIWEYVSTKPFNKERADMLVKLNIQVDNPYDFDKEAMKKFIGENYV